MIDDILTNSGYNDPSRYNRVADPRSGSPKVTKTMKLSHTIHLLAALSLILVPIICTAGLVPHCPSGHHDHEASAHGPSPHSSCLDNANWQVKKAPLPQSCLVRIPCQATVDPLIEILPGTRLQTRPIHFDPLPLLDGSIPLLS